MSLFEGVEDTEVNDSGCSERVDDGSVSLVNGDSKLEIANYTSRGSLKRLFEMKNRWNSATESGWLMKLPSGRSIASYARTGFHTEGGGGSSEEIT